MNRITSTVISGNNATASSRWQRNANAYTVQLRYQGRRYTFPFWTGKGWTSAPTTFDAAYCILSDASGYENALDFEDWASSYGYDTDSRTAETVYHSVARVQANVKRLLGDDYSAILYLDEDELQARCINGSHS